MENTPRPLPSYPRHRVDLRPAPFLPMSRAEMDALGWDACDVILVTGDAYIDHPSFGMALVGRALEAQGFRVGIISQPDWHSAEPFRAASGPDPLEQAVNPATTSTTNNPDRHPPTPTKRSPQQPIRPEVHELTTCGGSLRRLCPYSSACELLAFTERPPVVTSAKSSSYFSSSACRWPEQGKRLWAARCLGVCACAPNVPGEVSSTVRRTLKVARGCELGKAEMCLAHSTSGHIPIPMGDQVSGHLTPASPHKCPGNRSPLELPCAL